MENIIIILISVFTLIPLIAICILASFNRENLIKYLIIIAIIILYLIFVCTSLLVMEKFNIFSRLTEKTESFTSSISEKIN